MSIENPSLNKIFEKERRDFIPEVGEQLKKETRVEIEIGGEKLSVDYRIISVKEKEKADADPVILLPGFGSGWEGISELGFSLAAEGRKVILLSLPGYGNSGDPSQKYFSGNNFDNEAAVVKELIGKIPEIQGDKFHLIGHSLACEIITTFAEKYPDKTSSLVLLAPAGAKEKENLLSLGSRNICYSLSGMYIHFEVQFADERCLELIDSRVFPNYPRKWQPIVKKKIDALVAMIEDIPRCPRCAEKIIYPYPVQRAEAQVAPDPTTFVQYRCPECKTMTNSTFGKGIKENLHQYLIKKKA